MKKKHERKLIDSSRSNSNKANQLATYGQFVLGAMRPVVCTRIWIIDVVRRRVVRVFADNDNVMTSACKLAAVFGFPPFVSNVGDDGAIFEPGVQFFERRCHITVRKPPMRSRCTYRRVTYTIARRTSNIASVVPKVRGYEIICHSDRRDVFFREVIRQYAGSGCDPATTDANVVLRARSCIAGTQVLVAFIWRALPPRITLLETVHPSACGLIVALPRVLPSLGGRCLLLHLRVFR